jgi:hypothetical protein
MQYCTIITDWYFDSAYLFPPAVYNELQTRLSHSVLKWFVDALAQAQTHLRKSTQQSAARLQGGQIQGVKLNGRDVYALMFLLCLHGQEDSPGCQIYVGTKQFISDKMAEIKTHLAEQVKGPGTKAVITEHGSIGDG